MLLNELLCKHFLHVSCIELGIGNVIVPCILFGIFNRFRNGFNANDLFSFGSNELSNGACSCVQVVDQFIPREVCKITGYFLKFIGLGGVGLVKGFGVYFKLQTFHFLQDIVPSPVTDDFLIIDGIVPFWIDYVLEGSDLRKTFG